MTPEQHIAALTMPLFTQYGAANLSPLSHLVSGKEWVDKIRGITTWIYIPGYAINPVPAFDVAWHKDMQMIKFDTHDDMFYDDMFERFDWVRYEEDHL